MNKNSFIKYCVNCVMPETKPDFKIYDVLKNYSFNLCPHNSLYPGYHDEKIVNAFISKSLAVTWADKNINFDFNDKAFINLIDYSSSNYEEICLLIKDENFLRKLPQKSKSI